jgi:hypothetical protein
MKVITADQVHAALRFPDFIDALGAAFAGHHSMPPRQVMLLDEASGSHDAFAMLPSWNDEVIALKAFTYFPGWNFKWLPISARLAGRRTSWFAPPVPRRSWCAGNGSGPAPTRIFSAITTPPSASATPPW